jgi:hypothetical protein
MKSSSIIGSKGGVHVPRKIRNRSPRSETNPFSKYKGILRSFRGRKEIDAWIREIRGGVD